MVSILYIQIHTNSRFFNPYTHITSTAQWQCPVLELKVQLRQVHQMTQNEVQFSRPKVLICIWHTAPKPKFSSVSFYGEPFLSYTPLLRRTENAPQNDLDVFKVSVCHFRGFFRSRVHMRILHTSPRPKFSSVSLYNELFSNYGPVWGKSAPNDPKMTFACWRSLVHICILHTSPGPKFSSVLLYDEPYSRKLRFFNSPLVQCEN